MARTFDGTDDKVTIALGGTATAWTNITMAGIVRVAADSGVVRKVLSFGSATARPGLGINATNQILMTYNATTLNAPTLDLDVADGWALIAVSRASGTTTARFHKYVFSTNTWTHENDDVTEANESTAGTTASQIGARSGGSAQFWNGNIAVTGAWRANLTDAQVEALAYDLNAWWAVQPACLFLLDQSATTQKVFDLTGGGANETALTGTTVATSAVPVFSYGHPIRFIGDSGGGGTNSDLVIADASHAHSADGVDLTENKTLVVADGAHAHAADGVVLTQAHVLVVADSSHAHAADNVVLVENKTLVIADGAHGHTADEVALQQSSPLVIADSTHAHTADTVALVENKTLVVADTSHAHSADGVVLTQAHTLVVADSTHGHTADEVALTQASTLAVNDSLHAHTADEVTLAGGGSLAVDDATHAHAADEVNLTQQHQLAVADSLHAHSADAVAVVQNALLIVNDAFHAMTSDEVALTAVALLQINDGLHGGGTTTIRRIIRIFDD